MPDRLALLVDDDDAVRRVIRVMLARTGFTSIESRDGQHALDLLAVNEPDLLVLDLRMPNMDGFAFLASPALVTRRIPTMVITGLLALSPAQKRILGDAPVLYKPFTFDAFVAAVEAALWRAKASRGPGGR